MFWETQFLEPECNQRHHNVGHGEAPVGVLGFESRYPLKPDSSSEVEYDRRKGNCTRINPKWIGLA